MANITRILVHAGIVSLLSPLLLAQDKDSQIQALIEQNAALTQRLDQLEALVSKMQQPEQPTTSAVATVPSAAPRPVAKVEESRSGPKYSLGGFLKVDGFAFSGAANSIDAPRWAIRSNDLTGNEDTFNGTIQHSRLIGKISGYDLPQGKASAHLEADLFNMGDLGAGAKYNNNQLRFRQLFVKLENDSFSVLVGQAWDLFSPLNPTSLNTNGNYWFGGNSGFRRPQLRITKTIDQGNDSSLTASASVNANLGVSTFKVDTNGDDIAESFSQTSGQDSGVPVFEGSLKYTFKGIGDKSSTIGLSGVYGEEEINQVGLFGPYDVEQWGLALDLNLPISDRVAIKGEAYTGANLDQFLAGGGVSSTGSEIESDGAWLQLLIAPADDWRLNFNYGIEDIDTSWLNAGARSKNQFYGASLLYLLTDKITFGFEYTHFDTDYFNAPSAEADMLWSSLILKL